MAVVYEQKASDCEVFTFFGGVIFISIDDNEQAQLKLLCDEILGERNNIVNFAWVNSLKESLDEETKFAGSNLGAIKQSHEYVLVYKNVDFKINLDQTKNPYIIKLITNGSNAIQELEIPAGLHCLNKITKTIKGHVGGLTDAYDILNEEGMIIENGILMNSVTIKGPLRNPNTLKKYFNGETVIDRKGQKLIDVFIADNGMIHTKKLRTGQTLSSVLVGKGTTKNGTLVLKNMFGQVPFGYAKPIELISYLISKNCCTNATVLDFFAGSGTTLHATMQLNAEDGGHRKCILVTNNENNICEEVTYERNKRVIQGYTTPKGEEVEGLHDNNLRYYRTNFLSRDKSVKNMRQLVRLATDMLCIKNDVYTEAEFCGKKINPNIARYFDNGQGNRMLVIYEERAIQLLVQLMAQTEDDGIKTMVYVFSPGADPYTDDFEDIAERVKLCALPSAIYEAYKRVLPKRKPKFLDEALQEMKTQAEAEANVQQTLDFGEENDNMNEEGGEA